MIRIHERFEYETIFTQKDVRDFAELTNDLNPFHIDEEFARKNRFGRPIAQGVLVACAFSKVYFTKWPGNPDAFFINQDIMYMKPVYVNEPYTIKLECTAIDEPRAIGTIEGALVNKDGEVIVKTKARIQCEAEFSAPKM